MLGIFGAFLREAVASELLVSVAVCTFAVALLGMFVRMTGSLLSGLRRSAGPDVAAEYRQ